MDSQTKTGKVYLQPHKAGKKWRPVWLSLFPPSNSGVGRLEIQDIRETSDHVTVVKRHYQPHVDRKLKVVRLSELISVLRLPPNAEACPMDNMSAFCVETRNRTMVFAALKEDCVEWVEKLCHSAFQKGFGSDSQQLHMEENQIYASADEEFWVTVQRTDAAARCGLKGSYWLQAGGEALLLRGAQKKDVVREWPYELLRRYGKDKLALTIEAGRRCDSGPGTFTFETQQAEKIFSLIQSTIKRKTSSVTLGNQNQEGEKTPSANTQAASPLPTGPDGTSMASILETKPRIQGGKPQEDMSGSSAPPAPITLMPLPLVPTHDGHHLSDQSEAVYADPADCIQSGPTGPTTAQYLDPACFLPLKPPSSRESITPPPPSDQQDPVYSEVFDKISPVHNKPAEPVYSEPVSKKEEASHKGETKPDPFAHLYAQVCKTSSSSDTIPPCSSSSLTASVSSSKDPSADDVIYETLGVV